MRKVISYVFLAFSILFFAAGILYDIFPDPFSVVIDDVVVGGLAMGIGFVNLVLYGIISPDKYYANSEIPLEDEENKSITDEDGNYFSFDEYDNEEENTYYEEKDEDGTFSGKIYDSDGKTYEYYGREEDDDMIFASDEDGNDKTFYR